MKKLLLGTILLALLLVLPIPSMAGVNVGINIALPPLIISSEHLQVVVIPETDVYAAPDVDVDIFFYNGWWWRPWQGHWYRSHHYDSGWTHYQRTPSFYGRVPPGWRNNYRDHRWGGHPWNYQRIPHQQVQKNWSSWEKSKHWEKQNTWGVQGLKHHSPPHSGNVQSKHSQPQHQQAPQQSKPQNGKPEKGQKDQHGKKYDDK
jgi:hypothetical protein